MSNSGINLDEINNWELWATEKDQLISLRKEFERLASESSDPTLKWELSDLVAEIANIHTKEQFSKYIESVEISKHHEVVDSMKSIKKNELADLQNQIKQNSKSNISTSRPNLDDDKVRQKVANLGREAAANKIEDIISDAQQTWWFLWKIIWKISSLA